MQKIREPLSTLQKNHHFCSTLLTKIVLEPPYADPLTAFIFGRKEFMQNKGFEGCKFALKILRKMDSEKVVEYSYVHIEKIGHKSKMKWTEGIHFPLQLNRLYRKKLKNRRS